MPDIIGTMSATISAIADGVATLTFGDGQTLRVPAASLPMGSEVGGSVIVSVGQGNRDTERAAFAKDLLNEVFHVEDQSA